MEETTKHPGGRPSKYLETETISLVNTYLEMCGDVKETKYRTITKKDKDGNENQAEESYDVWTHSLPSIEGLALFMGLHKDTIYEWEKQYKEFSDVICKLRNMQAKMLIDNGLMGKYNSTISKVLLTKHGYREGIETTGNEGTPLNQNIAEAISKVYGEQPSIK